MSLIDKEISLVTQLATESCKTSAQKSGRIRMKANGVISAQKYRVRKSNTVRKNIAQIVNDNSDLI